MAFGLPNSTDLNGLADKLGAIVASLGPEESAVVNAAISQLSDHGTALLNQAGDTVLKIEQPVVEELRNFRLEISEWRKLLAGGLSGRIAPVQFTILPGIPPVPQALAAKS